MRPSGAKCPNSSPSPSGRGWPEGPGEGISGESIVRIRHDSESDTGGITNRAPFSIMFLRLRVELLILHRDPIHVAVSFTHDVAGPDRNLL